MSDNDRRQKASAILGGPLRPEELVDNYVVRDTPLSLDTIRRMLDAGDPVPPWIVRRLCERVESAERRAARWRCHCGWTGDTPDAQEAYAVAYEPNRQLPAPLCPACGRYFAANEFPGAPLLDVLATARAYLAAVDRCDGIVEAEQALRAAVESIEKGA